MQPAPSEASQTATSVNQSPANLSSSQHGIQNHFEQAFGISPHGDNAREPEQPLEAADDHSANARDAQRGRTTNTRRISNREGTSSHESSPGSRIEEYERAHTKPQAGSGGLMFQVVPTAKGRKNGTSVDDFPNG